MTSRVHLGRLLLAAQTAVAFALILGGGLFTASLARIWAEDPGLELRDLAAMDVAYQGRGLSGADGRARGLDLAVRLRATPGVAGAAVLDALVMQNQPPSDSSGFLRPDGIAADVPQPPSVGVSSNFFQTTGVELVVGRLPSDAELDTGAPVVAVSESLARAYWPGQSAIGQTLRARSRNVIVQVGVVRQLIGEQLGAVIAGTLAGGGIAAWGVRFVQAHLYETTAYDPTVWTTTIAVMFVTATFGAWIPARRASRVDPVAALRED
jgi:hypothetical protein